MKEFFAQYVSTHSKTNWRKNSQISARTALVGNRLAVGGGTFELKTWLLDTSL
jgi:hypothetical protein